MYNCLIQLTRLILDLNYRREKKLLKIFSSLQNPETGRFDVRYIFVDVDSYPRRTIVIEDNRQPTIKVVASSYGVFNDTGVASLHMNCLVFSIIPLGLSIYAAWGFVTGSNLSGPPLKFITDPAFEDKPMKNSAAISQGNTYDIGKCLLINCSMLDSVSTPNNCGLGGEFIFLRLDFLLALQ